MKTAAILCLLLAACSAPLNSPVDAPPATPDAVWRCRQPEHPHSKFIVGGGFLDADGCTWWTCNPDGSWVPGDRLILDCMLWRCDENGVWGETVLCGVDGSMDAEGSGG